MLFQAGIRSLQVLAPAKLNLFLRVVGRREDGYHELETVMTSVDLYDTLLFEAGDPGQISLNVVMASAQSTHSPVQESIPAGPENLVLRAANLLRADCSLGARITLIKRIPSAAGLGGGSSDAAATLAGLNRFWNLSRTPAELLNLAASLGSDVGFFLAGSSTAVCRGRGEQVEPLRITKCLHFVLAKPASGLSTAAVFKTFRPNDKRQSLEQFVSSLEQAELGRMVRLLLNDLQQPAESLNDEVRLLRQKIGTLPVLGHQMSGSGSACFGICASARHARLTAARLRAMGVPWVTAVKSCV